MAPKTRAAGSSSTKVSLASSILRPRQRQTITRLGTLRALCDKEEVTAAGLCRGGVNEVLEVSECFVLAYLKGAKMACTKIHGKLLRSNMYPAQASPLHLLQHPNRPHNTFVKMVRETIESVLTKFQQNNVIVRRDVHKHTGGQSHAYLSKRDIQHVKNNVHTFIKPSDELRSRVRMVRITRTISSSSNIKSPSEGELLQELRHNHGRHPNVTETPMLESTGVTFTVSTAPYLGPTLEQLIQCAEDEDWSHLVDDTFVYRTLRDLLAGLAFLHSGVQPNYTGMSPRRGVVSQDPTWRPIAHATSAKRIMFDVSRRDDRNFPKAVLVDFSEASKRPLKDPRNRWNADKKDLEAVAEGLHHLSHGRQYSNRRDPGTRLWCDCFSTTTGKPPFLQDIDLFPSQNLRNFLDRFAYADDTVDRACDLLAELNAYGKRTNGNFDSDIADDYDGCLHRVYMDFFQAAQITNAELKKCAPFL